MTPELIRTLLIRRDSRRWARHTVEHSRPRDEQQRVSTALLPGDGARLARLWVAEIFTPLDFPNISKQLDVLSGRSREMGAFRDYAEEFRKARRASIAGWITLPSFKRRGSRYFNPNAMVEKLPPGVEHVGFRLTMVTPSVAAIVAELTYSEDFSRRFGRLANRHYQTWAESRPGGGFVLHGVERQKERAAFEWRSQRVAEASGLLAKHFPGFFAREEGVNHPAVELILTAGFLPWNYMAPNRGSRYRALGLDGVLGPQWVCGRATALRAKLADIPTDRMWGSVDTLVFAAREDEIDSDPPLGFRLRPNQHDFEALGFLGDTVEPFALRWALYRLVVRSGERFNGLRDGIALRVSKATSKDFLRLRDDLLRLGVENGHAIGEIVEYANSDRDWNFELQDFSGSFPPGYPPSATIDSLGEFVKLNLLREADRLVRTEGEFRDLMSTSAEMTNAAFNARLQGKFYILAILSLVVALVALYVSYLSLK
ncbi:hypothetical protein [Kitasatospora terrestris]